MSWYVSSVLILNVRQISTIFFCMILNFLFYQKVRLVLLPGRKQKHKTKVRPGENPQFMESFVFNKINPGMKYFILLSFHTPLLLVIRALLFKVQIAIS